MVAEPRGTTKVFCTGSPFGVAAQLPSASETTQCAASQVACRLPLANGHSPVTRKPPFSAMALALLVEGPQASTPRGSFLKISSAISGFRHDEIVEQTEVCAMHHAVEASALASSSMACTKATGEISSPPSERGTSMRNKRASCSASTRSGGNSRPASMRGAAAAMRGASACARATQSAVIRCSMERHLFCRRLLQCHYLYPRCSGGSTLLAMPELCRSRPCSFTGVCSFFEESLCAARANCMHSALPEFFAWRRRRFGRKPPAAFSKDARRSATGARTGRERGG